MIVMRDDGCNILHGEWEADGDRLTFTGVSQAAKACPDLDTSLNQLDTATMASSGLTVFDKQGAELGTLPRG